MTGFKGSHSTPQTKEKQYTMCERDQAEAQEHQNTTVHTKTEFQVCQDMPLISSDWRKTTFFLTPLIQKKHFQLKYHKRFQLNLKTHTEVKSNNFVSL